MVAAVKLNGQPLTGDDRARLNNQNAAHVWLNPVQTAGLEPLVYDVIVPMFLAIADHADILAHNPINDKIETRMAFQDVNSAIQMYHALKDLGLKPNKSW